MSANAGSTVQGIYNLKKARLLLTQTIEKIEYQMDIKSTYVANNAILIC